MFYQYLLRQWIVSQWMYLMQAADRKWVYLSYIALVAKQPIRKYEIYATEAHPSVLLLQTCKASLSTLARKAWLSTLGPFPPTTHVVDEQWPHKYHNSVRSKLFPFLRAEPVYVEHKYKSVIIFTIHPYIQADTFKYLSKFEPNYG